MSIRFMMNTLPGDYRIRVFHEELGNNPDYIFVSEEEVKALSAKTITGPQIIQSRFLASRMKEAGLTDADVVNGVIVNVPSVLDEAPPAPPAPPAAIAMPVIDELPVETVKVDAESFMKGKSGDDLRTIGAGLGLAFSVETKKEMAAAIVDKMNAPVIEE